MYGIAVKSINQTTVVEKVTNQKRPIMDSEFISKLMNKEPTKKQVSSRNGLKVEGIDSMMMSLSQCCRPVYGDEIIGYITKGQGVKVHRKNCPNVIGLKRRLINVEWDENVKDIKYDSNVIVIARDRNFLLTDIVTVISQYKGQLKLINSAVNQEDLTTTTKMTLQVSDLEHLNIICSNLRKVDSVISVERMFV